MKLRKEPKEVMHPNKYSRYKEIELDEFTINSLTDDSDDIIFRWDEMVYMNKVERIIFMIIPN